MSNLVTAATVRDYFRTNKAKAASLSTEAAKTVASGARGRLHPEAIKAFNKGRKAHRRYVPGQSSVVKAQAQATAQQARAAAAVAGFKVGARGPLPREARAAIGLK